MPGLSAFEGFWGTKEISEPLRARSSCSSSASRSTSPTRTEPEASRVPCRVNPRRAIATVVLPEPLSPTMPSAVPGETAKLTSETMSTPAAIASTRRPSTTRAPASADGGKLLLFLVREPAARPAVAVDDQVDADREQGERDHRHQHGPRLQGQPDPVLADHHTPVRSGRLQPEAEEADRRDEQD